LDPTIELKRAGPESGLLPELELDGIPDMFFGTFDEDSGPEPFSLPSKTNTAQEPRREAEPVFEVLLEPAADNPLVIDDENDGEERIQLVGIPSGFFNPVDDGRGLDLPDDGPEAPEDYRVDAEEDFDEDDGFDFEVEIPSVLGEQNENENENEPIAIATEADRKPSAGHMTIPPCAGAVARPAADTALVQHTAQTAPTRTSSRPSRHSGSFASAARTAPKSRQQLRDAQPGTMIIPAMPVKAARSAESVPPMLSDQGPASPTRNLRGPAGSHREIGKSPRPSLGGGDEPMELNSNDFPLAASRRKTSGSHSVVPEELVLRPFESSPPAVGDTDGRDRRHTPNVQVDKTKVRAQDSFGCEEAPDFDEFDYAGISRSQEAATYQSETTSLGLKSAGAEALDGDLDQPPSEMLRTQRIRAQSTATHRSPTTAGDYSDRPASTPEWDSAMAAEAEGSAPIGSDPASEVSSDSARQKFRRIGSTAR
jgi:hypothetical protein